MHQPRDRFVRFLLRTHTIETCKIEQGHRQEYYEVDIQQFVEEFGELPQEGTIIFTNLI
jgi:hypothetical protein